MDYFKDIARSGAKRFLDLLGEPAPKRQKILGTREFAINSSIKKGHLEIPRAELQEIILRKLEVDCILTITGTRASGKTSLVLSFTDRNLIFVYLSAQTLTATPINAPDKEKRFWFTVWDEITKKCPKLELEEFSDGRGFANSFTKPRRDGKKVVLIWDEFDTYSHSDVGVWTDILDKIRALKAFIQARQAPLLQGVIIVGSYRAGKVPPALKSSPFNAHNGILPSHLAFKLEETKELFKMAQDEWRMKVDDDVVQNIHDITAGHAGMINLCGRYITWKMLELSEKHITMELWQAALVANFFKTMRDKGAFAQFESNAGSYEDPFKHRLALLASAGELVVTKDTKMIDEMIANEGYGDLVEGELILKCELVKQLLLRQILQPPTIAEAPLKEFDIINLLTVALKYFSPSRISSGLATKSATTTYAHQDSPVRANHDVPREAVYQVELFRVLYAWFAPLSHIQITNEVDVRREGQHKRSLDILYHNTRVNQQKFAIELVASTNNTDLDVHADRDYRVGLNADAEYIIHFTPVIVEREHMKFVAGTNGRAIPVIHVWHSMDGREYKIIRSANAEEDVTVTTAAGIQ